MLKRNRDTINNEDGLAPLIRLIATNHPALLVNVRYVSYFVINSKWLLWVHIYLVYHVISYTSNVLFIFIKCCIRTMCWGQDVFESDSRPWWCKIALVSFEKSIAKGMLLSFMRHICHLIRFFSVYYWKILHIWVILSFCYRFKPVLLGR